MKIHNINEFITSPDMSGYDSPIRMIVGEMETKMEADTMSVIQRYGIDVDKEELIKALNYDRGQYDKGYRDGYERGYAQAKQDIVSTIVGEPDIVRLLDIKSPSKCSQCKHMGDIDYCSNCHSDHSLFEEYQIKKG